MDAPASRKCWSRGPPKKRHQSLFWRGLRKRYEVDTRSPITDRRDHCRGQLKSCAILPYRQLRTRRLILIDESCQRNFAWRSTSKPEGWIVWSGG